ncbi:MAG: type III pantothenate kinase [Pseudomonadota bacterium]
MKQPSLLLIDAGNSSVKWATVSQDRPTRIGSQPFGELLARLSELDEFDLMLCSSVLSEDANASLEFHARRLGANCWFAQTDKQLGGLSNSYADSSAMGVDRWLAMLGAWHRFRSSLCVIDAGTALTIDFVDEQGCHQGGYIVPGAYLMRQSLFANTDRVRSAVEQVTSLDPGTSTADAVGRGVLLAQVGAIRCALEQTELANVRVCTTGGNSEQLAGFAHLDQCHIENLVLEGLIVAAAHHELIDDGAAALDKVQKSEF